MAATTVGFAPACQIRPGWLVLAAEYDGGDASWLQVGTIKWYDTAVALMFVNGTMSMPLAFDHPCATTGHHQAAA